MQPLCFPTICILRARQPRVLNTRVQPVPTCVHMRMQIKRVSRAFQLRPCSPAPSELKLKGPQRAVSFCWDLWASVTKSTPRAWVFGLCQVMHWCCHPRLCSLSPASPPSPALPLTLSLSLALSPFLSLLFCIAPSRPECITESWIFGEDPQSPRHSHLVHHTPLTARGTAQPLIL